MNPTTSQTFFNAVLRSIACTPNHNRHGGEASRAAIVAATDGIRSLEQRTLTDLGGILPDDLRSEVIALLDDVLTEKHVDVDDRQHYMSLVSAAADAIDAAVLNQLPRAIA